MPIIFTGNCLSKFNLISKIFLFLSHPFMKYVRPCGRRAMFDGGNSSKQFNALICYIAYTTVSGYIAWCFVIFPNMMKVFLIPFNNQPLGLYEVDYFGFWDFSFVLKLLVPLMSVNLST